MLFLSLAWLPLATLILSTAASIYFVNPPDAEKAKSSNDHNPVYGIGQEIEIEFHLDDSSAYVETANLWIEGPPADELGANDINNYIDQLAPDITPSPMAKPDSAVSTSVPTTSPPPPLSPYDGNSIQPPPGAAVAKTTPVPPGRGEQTNNAMLAIKARRDSLTLYTDRSVKRTWTVHLVNNPIAQSLVEKNGFAMARFRLDDIMNPQHKLARSRYFNITKRAVTPIKTGPPPGSTLITSRVPSSSSSLLFNANSTPNVDKDKWTNTAGTFTKRVTIGVAIGGTFAGLLTFGAVAFCLWRRFHKAALIRLDDETNDPDATEETDGFDASELEWSEKVGIGRPEPAAGFEITIVPRLETIHEDSDENSLNS